MAKAAASSTGEIVIFEQTRGKMQFCIRMAKRSREPMTGTAASMASAYAGKVTTMDFGGGLSSFLKSTMPVRPTKSWASPEMS